MLDQRSLSGGGDIGEISASKHRVRFRPPVLANHLWDKALGEETERCNGFGIIIQNGHMCWDTDSEGLNSGLGDTTWYGNELYFPSSTT